MDSCTERQTSRFRLIGVPSAAGSLFTGIERAASHYREADLSARLREAGIDCVDGGNLDIPSFLPRHDVPPVRNWPAPRIVWETAAPAVRRAREQGDVPLLVGGDCSIVTGVAAGLARSERALHVICVDGHVDGVAPNAERCVGAAAMGLWFATHESRLWHGHLKPSAVTVLGCTDRQDVTLPFAVFDAEEVAAQPADAAKAALAGIPPDAQMLVHFDVDVLDCSVMPAAYSPNPNGLTLDTTATVLREVVQDPRLAALEVTEYVPHKDVDGQCVRRIGDLLAYALAPSSCSSWHSGDTE